MNPHPDTKGMRGGRNDENVWVNKLYDRGFNIAFRVPGSGCGRLKGDVIGFKQGIVYIFLLRRGSKEITFSEEELEDLSAQTMLFERAGFKCNGYLVKHFPHDWHVVPMNPEEEFKP